MVQIGWNDVPHLDEDAKRELLSSIPAHQRDARARGVPMLGAGAIYQVPEERFVCDPFPIPAWWPKAFGLDVGWNRTAAVWGAWDRESDTVYLYSEYYVGQAPPQVHADAIKARGAWIKGAIDPASAGSGQIDGRKLMDQYRDLELDLFPAANAVEAGILAVQRRLESGRLKVFRTLGNLLSEYRLYRRDENGKVVKEMDHLMDAKRYLIMTGMSLASVAPAGEFDDDRSRTASSVSGY